MWVEWAMWEYKQFFPCFHQMEALSVNAMIAFLKL